MGSLKGLINVSNNLHTTDVIPSVGVCINAIYNR